MLRKRHESRGGSSIKLLTANHIILLAKFTSSALNFLPMLYNNTATIYRTKPVLRYYSKITKSCPNDNYNLIQFNASDLCTTQAISHTLIGCMLAHHYMENPAGHSRAAAISGLDCKTYATRNSSPNFKLPKLLN